MVGSRAALRVGLIGGLVLGLAVAAQQYTRPMDSDLGFLGTIITLLGLVVVGYLAARDAGDYTRWPAVRAGAVGGLIAGLLAALAMIAVVLALSMSGDYVQRWDEAMRLVYTPEQLQQLAQMGATIDVLTQTIVFMQIACCGGGLPIIGLLLGALGGALVPAVYRNRKPDAGDAE
jgi:hypothetical protein